MENDMKTCFQRGCRFVEYRNSKIQISDTKEITLTRRIETQRGIVLSGITLSKSEREHTAVIHQHGG